MKHVGILVLLTMAVPAHALEKNIGTSAAEFLRLGAGARALGMGEAYTAVAEGPDAVYWNPAGLERMDHMEAIYTRSELPAGIHHDFLAIGVPSRPLGGTLAFSVTRLSQESLILVNASNQRQGSFSPHSEVYAIAYGHNFIDAAPPVSHHDEWLLLNHKYESDRPRRAHITEGLSVKAICEDLGTRRAVAFAVDGGGMYKPSDKLTLAGAFRNLGSKLRFISESEPLPGELAAAIAYDTHGKGWRTVYALEVDAPYAGRIYGKTGLEISHPVADGMSAAVRFGYSSRSALDLGALSGATAGIGLRIGGFKLDAAFEPLGILGESFRIGVGWAFLLDR
ncbi:MAG: hypothetical protein AUJ51_00760 [Elusimicrobia bacterium CG1_02_56_21]|nr:MAG: hypothetical protein AUJ51_00760 [Elusimicrobia bacterium CG1_02_56_21]